jgi:hypothetical protein
MGTDNGGINKAAYEKNWANHAARLNLDDEGKSLWNSSKYTVRPHVYFDKIMIAWMMVKGSPQVKEVFHVTGADLSLQDGVWVKMQPQIAKGLAHLVTHVPRQLPGLKVFAWVPYFIELRYASIDWDNPNAPKALRLPVCFKMQEMPAHPHMESLDYLTELHVFRDMFPQYANTRF